MLPTSILAAALSLPVAPSEEVALLERVSTAVPFPRGLQLVEGQLYVLCRGRVREYGGVSAAVDDRAGTLFVVDPAVAEVFQPGDPGPAVRVNGHAVAEPEPRVFKLWDRSASPPWKDRETDRPYCGLSWHAPSQSFYICAFSGVDRDKKTGTTFSKNLTDAILRYDRRTSSWHEVERHDIDKGGLYPHQDPARSKPPHGWLNGPDNCLALGDWLYAVAKDNSLLVRYDLRPIEADPGAGPPPSAWVLGERVATRNAGELVVQGHSALAHHDGWLYLATRTTSHVLRMRLDERLLPVEPKQIELVAQFDAWDPEQRTSANLTDMVFDGKGRCHLISAQPSRVYRFTPDPERIFDARAGRAAPLLDMAALTGNPKMKSENLLVDPAGRIYVTSGDAYGEDYGPGGVVWRVTLAEGS
jgi:hypothetical protein